MSIKLFDVQAGFGGASPGNRTIIAVDELVKDMERFSIDRALVRIVPEDLEVDCILSNSKLYDACSATPALVPCPVVIPHTGYDLAPETDQVAKAISQGAAAVFLRPKLDSWRLKQWACEKLFCALEQRRMPAFCLERMFDIDNIADLAKRYPNLPFILAEGNYRNQRTYLPLLKNFHNIYLSIGNNFHAHKGLEQIIDRIGPEQLLFGTGFPISEPMSSVTMLMYADIPEVAKTLIGAGNMDRLIQGIVR